MASQPIYQFYSELRDYGPKIWRRFQVPGNITMSRLGYILMTMYEMKANHLFCLTVPIRENVALEGKMGRRSEGFVYPDEIWRFEIENEELFPEERAVKVYDASEHKMKSILLGCHEKAQEKVADFPQFFLVLFLFIEYHEYQPVLVCGGLV